MRRALSALLMGFLAVAATWAQVPTSNVLYRVLRLRTATATGSAFTIEVDGHQYLITARHLLNGSGSESEVELWLEGRWSKVRARAIYPAKEVVDIAALDLARPVTVTFPLEPSSGGLTLGQQVYFLGYPYGLGTSTAAPAPPGFGELPFLKSGIVSALDDRDPGASILYLDGQNNPGFSGGPIVFWHAPSRSFRVAGVVRGYRNEALPVLKRGTSTTPMRGRTTTCIRGPTRGSSLATTSGTSSKRSTRRAGHRLPSRRSCACGNVPWRPPGG